ncbi:MAG: hypothetical protein JSR25_09825 [Proteobacteria bacterium]|nr:hypothetical protein [Pseudomonadota bacterium]
MADATSSRSPRDRAARLFKNPADAWEERTRLVKREAEAERIAVDKKTARLKALRLEKEAAEREANPPAPPIEKPRRARKIITS